MNGRSGLPPHGNGVTHGYGGSEAAGCGREPAGTHGKASGRMISVNGGRCLEIPVPARIAAGTCLENSVPARIADDRTHTRPGRVKHFAPKSIQAPGGLSIKDAHPVRVPAGLSITLQKSYGSRNA